MGDNSVKKKHTVLVTGFGPFGAHTVNASWIAVQELESIGLGDDVKLVTHEIPVEYDAVSKLIPALWQQHKPQLVVHCGVSGITKELTFEQCAHNDGYDKYDVLGALPTDHCCKAGAPNCLESHLDMERVCAAVASKVQLDVTVSNDPGRYLCDFIYFSSLCIDRSRCAFIHVPPIGKPYSAQQLAGGIRAAIRAMLEQLQ